MEVALIPPIPDLHRAPHARVHLLLLHLLEDERYLKFYKEKREQGDYLILDNGAHELGAAQPHEYLLSRAKELNVQEVVLPDVLFDRRGTVERTKRMLKWICTTQEGSECYLEAGCPRFMLVPQGYDRASWNGCFNDLVYLWVNYANLIPSKVELKPPVIGISKDYDEWRGGLRYLIDHYVAPHKTFGWDVHILGWPADLWSIAKVAKEFSWIRSTDSAKPFVYAKNGILLEPGGKVPKYPKRDPQYFEEPLDEEHWNFAERNCLVYKAAANDKIILAGHES